MIRALALGALLALGASGALAQGAARPPVRLAGTVLDSTTMRPLPGALVQLAPADDPRGRVRSVTADTAGRWAVDSLARGPWLATFFHARLDSLGAPPPEYLVTVATAMEDVVLATPGPARVIALACPGGPAGTGAILGRVRDAVTGETIAGGLVHAEWVEVTLAKQGLRRDVQGSDAASRDDGWFALCGLRPGEEVRVRANRAADSMPPAELAVPPSGLVTRDLYVGRVVARLTGSVRSADGQPVAGARITVLGLAKGTVADSSGAWALEGVPGGTRMLEARGIGYAPERRLVDVVAGGMPAQDLVMVSLRNLLDTVRVSTTRRLANLRAFDERRKMYAAGHFMDEKQIARSGALRSSHVLERVPGLSLANVMDASGRVYTAVKQRGGWGMTDVCMPVLFLDGLRLVIDDLRDLDMIVTVEEIAGLEVYSPSTVPPEFQSVDGCASVVIWTNKGRSPRWR